VELKTAIVISQIIGYALSKYIGIKVCSEITPGRRVFALIFLILWGEAALVLYGIVPNNLKVVAIFLVLSSYARVVTQTLRHFMGPPVIRRNPRAAPTRMHLARPQLV